MVKKGLSREQKKAIIRKLEGFDKESHANGLASGLMRLSKDGDVEKRIKQANAVVSALKERGVTPFFCAEYAKTFPDSADALFTRERLIAQFEQDHRLLPKRAAKMADCIIFCVAKKTDPGKVNSNVDRMARMASTALSAGVEFSVVADTVYYNSPDISPEMFALRCEQISDKKNKPFNIKGSELKEWLSKI
jgi:hypothetical protein